MKSIELLLDELNKKLENEPADLGALALALIAIDICSKVEFNATCSIRSNYENWCDEYLLKYAWKPMPQPLDGLKLNGHLIYQIRCSVLHSGDTNLDEGKLGYHINFQFSYHKSFPKLNVLFLKSNPSEIVLNGNRIPSYECIIDLDYFVKQIHSAVQKYYNDNREKFCNVSKFKYGEIETSFIFEDR